MPVPRCAAVGCWPAPRLPGARHSASATRRPHLGEEFRRSSHGPASRATAPPPTCGHDTPWEVTHPGGRCATARHPLRPALRRARPRRKSGDTILTGRTDRRGRGEARVRITRAASPGIRHRIIRRESQRQGRGNAYGVSGIRTRSARSWKSQRGPTAWNRASARAGSRRRSGPTHSSAAIRSPAPAYARPSRYQASA